MQTESVVNLRSYMPEFDGVRAIAVILVMMVHSVNNFVPGGGFGVDIFFVLSGYLITQVLLNDLDRYGKILFKNFYVRRALRLLPALWLVLLFSLGLMLIHTQLPKEASLFATFAAATYLMNWVRAYNLGSEGVLGHTWSLSIEEQFYLIWPILLLVLTRYFSRNVAAISAIALGSISCIWRFLLDANGAAPERLYNGFDTRADGLLVGCALALWISAGSHKEATLYKIAQLWLLPIAIITLCVFSLLPRGILTQGGYTIVALATSWIIFSILCPKMTLLREFFSFTLLVWIGRISYGIYLWHFPIFLYLSDRGWKSWHLLAAGSTLTIIMATGSFFLVERWFLKLKTNYE